MEVLVFSSVENTASCPLWSMLSIYQQEGSAVSFPRTLTFFRPWLCNVFFHNNIHQSAKGNLSLWDGNNQLHYKNPWELITYGFTSSLLGVTDKGPQTSMVLFSQGQTWPYSGVFFLGGIQMMVSSCTATFPCSNSCDLDGHGMVGWGSLVFLLWPWFCFGAHASLSKSANFYL